MRAHTFLASGIMEVATRIEVQLVELPLTYMKRLRVHPRDLTRASKLTSCKRGLNVFEVTGKKKHYELHF
jgi:hypothetical protein